MIIYGFVKYEKTVYEDGSFYPRWTDILGNLMNAITVLTILVYIAYKVYDEIIWKKKASFFRFEILFTFI